MLCGLITLYLNRRRKRMRRGRERERRGGGGGGGELEAVCFYTCSITFFFQKKIWGAKVGEKRKRREIILTLCRP